MNTHGYPESPQHKAEHDNLTRSALELEQKFRNGKAFMSVEMMSFLKDWLIKHILGTDKKYAPFLNNKGIA